MDEQLDDTTVDAVKNVIDSDNVENIKEQIKNITITALSQRQLDKDNIKRVIMSILNGLTDGVDESTGRLKPLFEEALSGIDDALAKSVVATKLAAHDATDRVEKFAKNDVRHAVEQMEVVEDLFIDSINTFASESSKLTKTALNELADQFKNRGTQSGQEAREAISSMKDLMLDAGKGSVHEITAATKAVGNQFAHVTSGVLSGIAEAIKPKQKD